MRVVEFIKTHGVMALAAEPYCINIKAYPEHDYYVLNYDQIHSKPFDHITKECRGLIVTSDGTIVSRSFDRFFNYLEDRTIDYAALDLADFAIVEKADGTLVKLYWSPATDRWEISTRSTAFAEGRHKAGLTYRDWILEAMGLSEEQFQIIMSRLPKQFTINLEYIGPENQHVTRYNKSEMVLLGCTTADNGHGQLNTHNAILTILSAHGWMNIRKPKTYAASTWAELIKIVESIGGGQEGVVLRSADTTIKLKSTQYLVLHKTYGNKQLTTVDAIKLILTNETSEYLSYFPNEEDFIKETTELVNSFIDEAEFLFNEARPIDNKAEFAKHVCKSRTKALLFDAYKHKPDSIKDLIGRLDIPSFSKYLAKVI